jgi:uncharacterized membrane protein YkgB
MFEGITCVYKSNVDLFFYVFGSSNENELMLSGVLSALYEAISITLRENVEKVCSESFGVIIVVLVLVAFLSFCAFVLSCFRAFVLSFFVFFHSLSFLAALCPSICSIPTGYNTFTVVVFLHFVSCVR